METRDFHLFATRSVVITSLPITISSIRLQLGNTWKHKTSQRVWSCLCSEDYARSTCRLKRCSPFDLGHCGRGKVWLGEGDNMTPKSIQIKQPWSRGYTFASVFGFVANLSGCGTLCKTAGRSAMAGAMVFFHIFLFGWCSLQAQYVSYREYFESLDVPRHHVHKARVWFTPCIGYCSCLACPKW